MKFDYNDTEDHCYPEDSMSVNQNFQTWLLFGWQHTCQPIRSHVRKSLLNNMDFNIGFLCKGGPQLWDKCQLMSYQKDVRKM